MTSPLPKLLQPALKALEKDLLTRARLPAVESGLRMAWEGETSAGQTGLGFDPWRRERVTQIAVAWILSLVFVRTLEDRALIDPRVSGPNAEAMSGAEDREAQFLELAPFLGIREYLLTVFRELSKLPGTRDVFDARHNPVWVLSPSSEGAQALVDFFRKRDATGVSVLLFTGEDTRFLGDLYQDLSEAVRKRYALLQTPEFIEEFILDQTLNPAIAEFGLEDVSLIDPTCGSGHFLLGAFRRLLGRWQEKAPTENVAGLARKVLDQVYGVDINPYAVAIARFRLVLAVLDAIGIKRLEQAPDIKLNVVVADSLLHRFGAGSNAQTRFAEQLSLDDIAWGEQLFRLEDRGAVERVLTKRFHAVVGNPPYITEKDATKRKKYHEMYESASGRYSLSAPFTERFFELGLDGGFVGLINSNAWTKRDFGKPLIEKVLSRYSLEKLIDTSGCFLPGHGTPTLLLFGRNRPAAGDASVVAVLGKRGEEAVPLNPETAPVWSEIAQNHNTIGFEGKHTSVEEIRSTELRRHPWILVGGGGRALMRALETAAPTPLRTHATSIGVLSVTGNNDVYVHPVGNPARLGAWESKPFVTGEHVRDWSVAIENCCLWPFGENSEPVMELGAGMFRFLWSYRTDLSLRRRFGVPMLQRGLKWYELQEFYWNKVTPPQFIVFAFVSTHPHFSRVDQLMVLNNHAPIIKLQANYGTSEQQTALGFLNSSTVAFWCRLVMFDKGAGGGAIKSDAARFKNFLEYAGNLLQQLPFPELDALGSKIHELVVAAEETVHQMAERAAEIVVRATLESTPSLAALRAARAKNVEDRGRLLGILVSLQEEIDWRVYGMFGLPTIEAPSVKAVRVPVEPNHRPFEVRLARDVKTDISSSEWFRVHRREAPKDVGGPLADLYRQRLRLLDDAEHGRHLRLLEKPETKRRWSLPEDTKLFSEAVRKWLLERIESSFRHQPQPELRTARQIALEIGRDLSVAAAHELLSEESGLDLVKLVSELVESEGVPFLAGYRYSESGMEKRTTWEETWRLQRIEDEDKGKLEAELKRLGLKSIPVPDKYGSKDFLHHFWSQRGKLDVPKERFVSIPGGTTDEDTTPVVGWAGWNHLQLTQALSGLYQHRKAEDGWAKERLVPLLAGIYEHVPWLLQWHNEPSASFGGMKLGEFFRDFVAAEAHVLGVVVDDLRRWTPPTAANRTAIDTQEVLAALKKWKPELNEDVGDDDESEQPEGPTEADLSSMVGVTKVVLKKMLNRLEADGLVEKVAGRPARYVATGDES